MNGTKFYLACLLGTSALAGTASPVFAQEVGAEQGIADIVVTARRQSENLQSTPVAVTALTSEALDEAQVNDVSDLQRMAPSLNIARGGGSPVTSFAYVSIRGQSNLNGTSAADSAVGIYVDGVYIARPAGALFDLVDMERVEVLRGPQGTLFGRATTGGALQFITKKPTGELSGSVEATAGNYSFFELTGIANLPIRGDEVAVRIAYKHKQLDGYGRNLSLNIPVRNNNEEYVRGQIAIAPAGAVWDLNVTADYNEGANTGQLHQLVAYNRALYGQFGLTSVLDAALIQNVGYNNGRGQQYTSIDRRFYPHNTLKNYGLSATLNVDLGGAKLKSITGYRNIKTGGWADLDGSDADILSTFTFFKTKGFSQEFQVSGDIGKLSYIAGLYYFRETGTELAIARSFGFRGTPFSVNDGEIESTSKAAFAQAYYKINDRLKISAGLRWTWDKRFVNLHNLSSLSPRVCGVASVLPAPGCSLPQTVNFNYPAYTFGMDYQVSDDVFVYAKSSAAKMAGGFNLRLGSVPAFRPEGVRDVEFGLKADLLDRRLRTNLAVFHSWQKDVQRTVGGLVNNFPQSFVQNAGRAQITGVEFEGVAVPWSGMQINGSVSYMHGEYDAGSYTESQTIAGIPGCNGGQPVATYVCVADLSGQHLPQTPAWTFNIGATQTFDVGIADLVLRADYAYISSLYFNGSKTPAAAQPAAVKALYATQTALNRADGYGVLSGRIALKFEEPAIELSVWGRNLTDKKFSTRKFPDLYSGLGYATQYNGTPRTYGVTVKAGF